MSRDLDMDFEFEEGFSNRPQGRGGINPSMAQNGGMRPQGGNQRPQGGGISPQQGGMRQQQQQRPPMRQPQQPMRGPQGGQPVGMNNGMGMGQMRGPAPRQNKSQVGPIIILVTEIVIFIALIVLFFVLKGKIENPSSGEGSATEQTSEGQSGGVNVDNDDFKLECTKVQLANDANGAPAALVYFTFVNKTATPLSMQEVFPPSLAQNGIECSSDVILSEEPAELYNKDQQISDGNSLECCFAFSLSDLTSTLTLTIKDNYKTFTDIGSTEIPLS